MRNDTAPADGVFVVTPHDVNYFPTIARSLYVGGAGDVVLTAIDNSEVTFTVPAGTTIPVKTKRVKATGTTATNIIGLI